jgi:SCP-2 sterol transfer family protein
MNLLGLFMKAALESRVERIERARPSGDIALTAGAMSVTLSFSPDRVVIRKGVADKPRAHVKGSLEGMIEVARGRAVAPFLRRRVRLSGNPLALLPLSRVFRKES